VGFGRRGLIGDVRGACRLTRFPGRCGVQVSAARLALEDLVRIVAASVFVVPDPRMAGRRRQFNDLSVTRRAET
jgi:hypothetical protein